MSKRKNQEVDDAVSKKAAVCDDIPETGGCKPEAKIVVEADEMFKLMKLKHNIINKINEKIVHVHCWCNKKCVIKGAWYVCNNDKKCNIKYQKSAIEFILDNQYFHDLTNTAVNIACCNVCSASNLMCSNNEKFSTYGSPQWTCNCGKAGQMYVPILKTYRDNFENCDKIWNMANIDKTRASVKNAANVSLTAEAKASYYERLLENAEEV